VTQGGIYHRARAEQLLIWPELRWGNIRPTDVDAFVDFRGDVFVWGEVKLRGKDVPQGQRIAMDNMRKVYADAGRKYLFFIAEHNVPCGQDIRLEDTTVRRYCWHGGYWKDCEILTRDLLSRFVSRFAHLKLKEATDGQE